MVKHTESNVTLHIDDYEFKVKPNSDDIKAISNRICDKETTISIEDLADKIQSGCSVLPCIMSSNRRLKKNFVSTELIFLDFDNTKKIDGESYRIADYISYESIKEDIFITENACFIYKTFTNTDEINRFRVVIRLDANIEDRNFFDFILRKLLDKYPMADISCKDVTRIFYGGLELEEINYNNKLITTDYKAEYDVVNPYVKYSNYQKIDSVIRSKSTHNNIRYNTSYNANNVTRLIQGYNIEEYRNYLNQTGLDFITQYSTRKDIIYHINSLDTRVLLNINTELATPFKCILTEDNEPSANIFKNMYINMYEYRRFSSTELVFNNIELFQVLLNTEDKDRVVDFFIKTLDLTLSIPEYLIPSNTFYTELCREIIKITSSPKSSYIKKVLKPHNEKITNLITYMLNNPLENKTTKKVEYISGKSTKTFCKLLLGSESKTQVTKTNILLNLLSYLNIVTKLDESEYPTNFNSMKTYKTLNHYKAINSVYKLAEPKVELSDFILHLENSCKHLKENGYTFRGFNQDFISIIDSIDSSNKVYKQSQNKKISTQLTRLHTDIEKILVVFFTDEKNKFILENTFKQSLVSDYGYSHTNLKNNYNTVLSNVLYKLNLTKVKLSNPLKEVYKIETSNYPYIIHKL